ncbi:hypothetical protein ACFQ4C_23825 [Larkinella insperata]|uniref:Uncharacterized protein n=1 Tax=Larkinella insperata TaxID=332158 RepID=A0ABW3QIR1_9BACT|nr:hypothetical protein [Larkinella insperata]
MSTIQRVNPDGMMSSPGFSLAIVAEGSGKPLTSAGRTPSTSKTG